MHQNPQQVFFPNLVPSPPAYNERSLWCTLLSTGGLILAVTVNLLLCLVSRDWIPVFSWSLAFNGVWMTQYLFIEWYAFVQLYRKLLMDTRPQSHLSWRFYLYLVCGLTVSIILGVQGLFLYFEPWSVFVRNTAVQSLFFFAVIFIHPWLARKWIIEHQDMVWTDDKPREIDPPREIKIDDDANLLKKMADELERQDTQKESKKSKLPLISNVPLKQDDSGKVSIDFVQALKDNHLVAGISANGIKIGRRSKSSHLRYLLFGFAGWMFLTLWLQGLEWKWISFVSGFVCMVAITALLLYKDKGENIFFDVSYLQFYMSVIPYLPILFTDYVWSQYISNQQYAFFIVMIYTLGSQLYTNITRIVVQRLSAPRACSQYNYIVSQTNYFFQYALFGPAEWSMDLFAIIIWTYTFNLLMDTGIAEKYVGSCCSSGSTVAERRAEDDDNTLLQNILDLVFRIKQTGEDAVAELIALIAISCFFYYYPNERFVQDKIWLRLSMIILTRIVFGFITVFIFHRHSQRLKETFEAAERRTKNMLRQYLQERLPSTIYLDLTVERYVQMYPEVFAMDTPHWSKLWMIGLPKQEEFLYFFCCASVVILRLLHGIWSIVQG